jgi:hypothetical protein
MKSLLLASAVAGALGLFAAPAFAHGDRYDRGYGDSYYQYGRYDDGYGERDGRHRHFRRGWNRYHARDWSYRHERNDSWRGWHRHDWRSYE